MLKLKDIKKDYLVADMKVEALKGINLCFRQNEFVSILGPSGCGKTTMLNIIGGLDKYSSGDLTINGRSTKEFSDRDWDVYRNHRIGFIFQSYNLIPHQTILGNVELALTIAGIDKAERVERAKAALDKVGLAGQYNKKPNQLSGGQCQRVAIARALVNEPEILLADEPTGALDTVTSVQIMDLIKEISQEKLVIMVTHNPDLAYKYSTRIVKLLDGQLLEDSNPFSEEEEAAEVVLIKNEEEEKAKHDAEVLTPEEAKQAKKHSKEKAKMSMWTAFKLSARNLYSKMKRTIMVVIAGSIGIIGVSTVLAVSQGVRDYITSIQDDLLSGNPISISKSGFDYSTLLNSSSFQSKTEAVKNSVEDGKVNVNSAVEYLVQNQKALDSLTFQNEFDENYISYILSMPEDYYNTIALDYNLNVDFSIYTDYKVSYNQSNPNYAKKAAYDRPISLNAINSSYSESLKNVLESIGYEESKSGTYANLITNLSKPISQSIDFDNNVYIKDQYDLVAGRYPKDVDGDTKEVLIVLDSDGLISDLTLAQLGYYSQEEFYNIIYNALNESTPDDGKEIFVNTDDIKKKFTHEELLSKTFRWYPNNSIFTKTTSNFDYAYEENEISNKSGMITLQPTGIIKLKEGTSYGALGSGFLYSEKTAKEFIRRNIDSELNQYVKNTILSQNGNLKTDSITSKITYELKYYWESLDDTTSEIKPFNGDETATNYNKSTVVVGEDNSSAMISSFFTSGQSSYNDFSDYTPDPQVYMLLASFLKEDADINQFIQLLSSAVSDVLTQSITAALSNKKISLGTFGGTFLPNSIKIYPVNFDSKDKVTNYLDDWNKIEGSDAKSLTFNLYNEDFTEVTGETTITAEDRKEIKYTDTVGIIIGLINTMINIVTYALVAFTALSLVVSTVMVAIITYVSVMERVKEIGVIRSLGGRKKDVSHLFNAEAFIIGLTSGIFGVVFTYIIQIFANIVIKVISDGTVQTIANLTPLTALIMVLVSILLTSVSGLLPARSAARKDPVVALRTE